MKPRILTTHWGQKSSATWRHATTYVKPTGKDWASSIRLAWHLYTRRLDFDCVVVSALRSGLLFAGLQALMPGRKAPTLMLDCYWYRHSNALKRTVWKLVMKVVSRGCDRFIVWTEHERGAYSSAFGLNMDKFAVVPYHLTVLEVSPGVFYQADMDLTLRPADGGYVFSGGNSDRDFKTLVDAVEGLDIEVRIATQRPGLPSGMSIPSNVRIRPYRPDEFVETLAGCRINVVPIKAGLLRAAGQQTFLNSMLFGKPTIVTDMTGGPDYIDDGVNGLLTPAGDVAALRAALKTVMDDADGAARIGVEANLKARRFTTEAHFTRIVDLASEVSGHSDRETLG